VEEPVSPGVHSPAVDELDILEDGRVDVRVVEQEKDRLSACVGGSLNGEDLRVTRIEGDHTEPAVGFDIRVVGAPDMKIVECDAFL